MYYEVSKKQDAEERVQYVPIYLQNAHTDPTTDMHTPSLKRYAVSC